MKTLIAFCLLTLTARAGLKWEHEKIALEVLPAQLETVAVFRFSNAGKKPVTIREIKVSCGCLAPKPARKTYGPGECGELTVRFDLRNRTGPQSKSVAVTTSDGQRTTLTLSADIPVAYHIAPIMMKWVEGNAAKTKTARLTNPNKMPIRILSATSSHKDLPVELKTVREGFEYEVVVMRRTEARNIRAVVRIQLEPPPGLKEAKTPRFYVHVQ